MHSGEITVSWDAKKRVCNDVQTYWFMSPMQSQVLLASSILLFSIISIVLTFKAIFRALYLYSGTKRRLFVNTEIEQSYWSTLNSRQRLTLILNFCDVWNVISIVGNACNVASAVLNIMMDLGFVADTDAHRFLTGFGCMLSWIKLIRYLEYYDKYYALVLTLKNATPGVIRFTVGAAPLFVGYALFGVVYFGPDSELFANFPSAGVTLFSLLNGDSVLAIFTSLHNSSSHFASRIYLYTFVGIFILAVFNIFVVIIEEAFRAAKDEEDVIKPADDLNNPDVKQALLAVVRESQDRFLVELSARLNYPHSFPRTGSDIDTDASRITTSPPLGMSPPESGALALVSQNKRSTHIRAVLSPSRSNSRTDPSPDPSFSPSISNTNPLSKLPGLLIGGK
eukprot:c17816_g1_i2.p1 GENE.c17816_g1_i2~~c17816_g1_i2.p1  ORF type:complete len:395 (+),score=73.09 c17816_g1_i2:1254-2438(+)